MLELLKGGIIKGRHKKYNDADRKQQKADIQKYRSQNLSDRSIAIKMNVSYFTVAEMGSHGTNYQ